jgi:hypothetical protein
MNSAEELRFYSVSTRQRAPLVEFIVQALETCGCRLLHIPSPSRAPFRFTFETPEGERMGILVYAFLGNSKITKNRPKDEHRFQVKYGQKDGLWHPVWQDPYSLYTTLFCGIDPSIGIFVGADPSLHNPTRLFISIEYKQAQVDIISAHGWTAWERDRRSVEESVEVLVGGDARNFLRYIRFERDALGEAQGERALLAERPAPPKLTAIHASAQPAPSGWQLHALAKEFQLNETEVLDLISSARRLKMAVRGWVAEEHLVRKLRTVPGVSDCTRNDAEGQPDVTLKYREVPLTIECKNVLRKLAADGTPRMDFQRTRASKADPCSRYYAPSDFDVVAACLHAVEEQWSFRFVRPSDLDAHTKCAGKLSSNVRVDSRWLADAALILQHAAQAA